MKHKLYLVMMIIVLGLLIFSGACARDEAQIVRDTVVDFLETLQNRDFDRSLDFFSQNLRDNEGDLSLVRKMQFDRVLGGASEMQSLGEPLITGKQATIVVDYKGILGLNHERVLSLSKEGSSWKIDHY
jgi:hypothetical protein